MQETVSIWYMVARKLSVVVDSPVKILSCMPSSKDCHLFKAVRVGEPTETRNHPFLNVKFVNEGIDALNVSNILNQKSVQNKIPPYFQYKESPCISYSFNRSVASKIFNYKASLQQLDFQGFSQDLPPCNCSDSQFLYVPCGHIVTGDLNIVRNVKLRDLLSKGPKYREPVSYTWHQNFCIIMDACEEYARRWVKKEDFEVDTLSEWIKSIADVLKRRIQRLKHSVNTRHECIFSDPDVVRKLSRLHENFVIVPADKASNNYTFVCKRHYISILSEELGLNSLPGKLTPWEPYIKSHGFFCIRSAGQLQIGPHFIWNRDKWRWARFAIHILDSKDAQKSI